MKSTLQVETVAVIMSGNFTQRGEPAILDKYTRAKHAVMAGADVVIELPTVFATANAELFAKGGVKIMNAMGFSEGLCFGVESGSSQDFYSLANMLNDETKEYKKAIKEQLSTGVSLAKAKIEALKITGKEFDEKLISTPNNILGLEYTKALLLENSKTKIYPFIRQGDHNDKKLKKGETSATSIRQAILDKKTKKVKPCVPKFVYADLNGYPLDFDKLISCSVLKATEEDLKQVLDCTEGLENRIKALSKNNCSVEKLVEKVSTKRYSKSRIRRILLANFLGINKEFVLECLSSPLYAKILAVNQDKKDIISQLNKTSSIPLLTRKSDADKLSKTAKKCFMIDVLAQDLYNLATNDDKNENFMMLV